jgi:hypothetical protein
MMNLGHLPLINSKMAMTYNGKNKQENLKL